MLKLLLLGLLATSALGGFTPRRPLLPFHGRIIGGNTADAGEYPSQLSLQFASSHNCGASIISANWALTASHCVEGSSPSFITLLSGSLDWTQGGTRHTVARIIMHESYNSADSWINDIAVIEVVEPFEMSDLVQPIKLPEQDQTTATGSPATVIGWGATSYFGPLSEELLEVEIEIRDQDLCQSVYNSIGYNVYPSQICADVPEGNIGSCNGDSGGPLFVDETVVGLVSWANGCATPGYPTVYTRVASYRDWIQQNTGV